MATESFLTRFETGDGIVVVGERTETEGVFKGLGLSERGEVAVILRPQDAVMDFAYSLDEVKTIRETDK